MSCCQSIIVQLSQISNSIRRRWCRHYCSGEHCFHILFFPIPALLGSRQMLNWRDLSLVWRLLGRTSLGENIQARKTWIGAEVSGAKHFQAQTLWPGK